MADGLGQPNVEPLSAGTTAQPLVPQVSPAVTPDYVKQLGDAFHTGAINAQDVADRIGQLAQMKKRAAIEELQEYVSPQAIQSRMAQHQLAGAQAQADLGLVQPKADLLATQLQQQQATTVYGAGGLQAIQTLGPWYGQSMENFRDPDTGQIDFAKASQAGNEIAAKNAIINNWFDRLTPAKEEDVTDSAGQTRHVTYNKFGQVISPPNPQLGYKGSDSYWYIVHQLDNLMPDTHPLRGAIPTGDHPIQKNDQMHGGDGPVLDNNDSITVTPANQNEYYAEYAKELRDRGIPNPETTALKVGPDALQAWVTNKYGSTEQPTVSPSQAAALQAQGLPIPTLPTPNAGWTNAPQPKVEALTGAAPTAAPQPQLDTGVGPVVKPAQTPVQQREEIFKARTDLRKQPDVDEYYKALPTYTKFADSARRAPVAQNGPTDLGLAENYSKMHDPTTSLREFKFDALAKQIPLLEKYASVPEIVKTINRDRIFPPHVRQEIIEDGMRTVDAAEGALKAPFAAAEQTLPGTLDAEQKQILAGVPFSQRRGHSYTSAPAADGFVTLPSGKRVRYVP